MPHCAAFAGPSGPAFFFFCLSPVSLNRLSPSGDALVSSHLGLATAPGFAHNWVTHLQQGWSGAWVVLLSLPRPLTGQKPPHRAEFGFSPQNEFTPPPKGGGAGYCFSLVVRVLLGSCLWQLLATTGSHASNRACLGLRWCHFLTWLSKSHTGPHRAEFRFHRFFFLDFLGGSPASWRSRW